MSLYVKIALGVLGLYLAVTLVAYFGQRKLLYFPDSERVQPAAQGLRGVAERLLSTPDGERLIVWYGKARPGQPTLLYFHGNGGNLADRVPRVERFMGEGWGVYMLAWRGYAGSSGSPTETNNAADSKLAYDALVAEGVAPQSIIVYGESLGSNLAARIAAEKRVAGVVLDAPFTSIVAMAAKVYPYLPVGPLVLDRYETDKMIGGVKVPVLILHGERDSIVPVAMGRELARLANEPKRLVTFPNGGHSDLYVDGNDALAAVRAWVRTLRDFR